MTGRWLLVVLGACAGSAAKRPPPPVDPDCLTIGAWNDLHGQIGADEPIVDTGVLPAGGVIALADAIGDLRTTTDPVVLLDAGDLFTGPLESTLSEGAPIIEAYRSIGVDAAAIGNHEFDFGPEGYAVASAPPGVGDEAGAQGPRGALLARMRSASFPFLSANIRINGVRPQWPNFAASVHIHRGGFDVGVVGYTTQETPSTTSRANVVGLDFSTQASESVAAEIRALRASGASPVVLLAHASLDGALPQKLESSVPEHGELATLVAGLGADQPDVIIAGHRHAWMLGRIHGVPVVSSDQHGVGIARIRFCRAHGSVALQSIERIAVVASSTPRTQLGRDVSAVTAPWLEAVRVKGQQVIATLPRECPVRNVNGTAGAEQVAESMVAHAMELVVKPTSAPLVAMVNTGAIRAPLHRGVIRYADLFRAFPFETTVALCGTTRAGLARVLKNALRDPSAWKEFPFALAGAKVTVDLAQSGTLSLLGYSIDGDLGTQSDAAPVWLAIPDFILDGGDGFLDGVECTMTARSSARIRDAWIEVLARDPDGCGGAPNNVVIHHGNLTGYESSGCARANCNYDRAMRALLAVVLVGCQQSTPAPAAQPAPKVVVDAATPDAPSAAKAIQAKDLFDHPEWIGTVVHVDLDASFLDAEHSSIAERGELDVEVVDVGPNRLALARADHKPITMAGTIAPVHVVATLREGTHGLRLEATSIEHFARPAPIAIASPDDILKDPAKFAGVLVTFEADWLVGFEVSDVGDRVWMDSYPDVKLSCEPPPPTEHHLMDVHTYRVRVIGMAYTAGHYGHMSMSDGLIRATEVAYLDPKRPACR